MQRVRDYELRGVLGSGASATVHRAWAPRLGREVALKVFPWSLVSDAQRKRFQREAEALARLRHPNVIGIHEVGVDSSGAFLAMELVDGARSLDQVVAKEGPLPVRRVLKLAAGLARALDAVHEAGLVHRDVKPANVLVDRGGVPLLCDFGLVRRIQRGEDDSLTIAGQFLGTPSFMPPEQALGDLDQVGPASDIYAFGATLFTLLAGEPPFRSAALFDALDRTVTDTAPPPSSRRTARAPRLDPVPPALDGLVLRCLAKEPDDRPETASAVARELDAIARELSSSRGRPGDSRPVAYAIVTVVAVAAAFAAGALWQGRPPVQPAPAPPPAATPINPGPPTVTLEPETAGARVERAALLVSRGLERRAAGDPDEATRCLERAITELDDALRLEPDAERAHAERGRARVELGRFAEGLPDLDRALAREPRLVRALTSRGRARCETGDLGGAIADLDLALSLDATLPEASALRGVALVRSKRDFARARDDLDRAIRAGLREPWALGNRGVARLELGDASGALEDLEAAVTAAPRDPWLGVNLAVVLAQTGDTERALRRLDEVLEHTPGDFVARGTRGALRSNTGRVQEALVDLDQALLGDPGDIQVRFNRAITRRRARNLRGAVDDLDQTLRATPDQPAMLYERGSILAELGDEAAAATDLRSFLRVAPQDPRAASVERWLAERKRSQ